MESGNVNSDMGEPGLETSFSDKDRYHRPGNFVQRRFRDPLHFLNNLAGLLGYVPDIVRVYVFRAISPRLRELIMLTVSGANDCNA